MKKWGLGPRLLDVTRHFLFGIRGDRKKRSLLASLHDSLAGLVLKRPEGRLEASPYRRCSRAEKALVAWLAFNGGDLPQNEQRLITAHSSGEPWGLGAYGGHYTEIRLSNP